MWASAYAPYWRTVCHMTPAADTIELLWFPSSWSDVKWSWWRSCRSCWIFPLPQDIIELSNIALRQWTSRPNGQPSTLDEPAGPWHLFPSETEHAHSRAASKPSVLKLIDNCVICVCRSEKRLHMFGIDAERKPTLACTQHFEIVYFNSITGTEIKITDLSASVSCSLGPSRHPRWSENTSSYKASTSFLPV